MNYLKKLVTYSFCLIFPLSMLAQDHPSIMLSKVNMAAVRKGINTYPLLKYSYSRVKKDADKALITPILVPVPKDAGGGYTHEQHKKNYINMLNCGIAFQVSGDNKYARYVKEMLLKYAADYEKWPVHPKKKENHEGGKIFWQSLNDYVWQVYTIQSYDMVFDAISAADRKTIETHLFMPVLKFFTVDCCETFDKIHNHGTWNIAAVGMTGYVLNKPDYVEMAIKGFNKDGKTGYLAQVNQLFSPDGYYTEGPYYQRYALLPFVIFAKTINNFQPELKIFQYRNRLLAKAIQTSLQLTYTDGTFFPLNDAIKDKTYESAELVYGVDIAYADINAQPELLDIAKRQNEVVVSDAGLKVAAAVQARKEVPFAYQTMLVADGAKGDEGGIGILRYGQNNDQQCVVVKAASQGMGHGHFDRLNLLYYDNGTEVFPDYGSARFLNIESKRGGDYLPENTSWAKQTIAHNTLVVDQRSNFEADVNKAQRNHAEILYFKANGQFQLVSGKEVNAYPGVEMKRTSALLKVDGLEKPLLIDIFQANSLQTHRYDLPFWYKGNLVDASFPITVKTDAKKMLGKQFGYQHLWLNAEAEVSNGGMVTILNQKRFYTTHFISDQPLNFKLVSLGANDPELNLTAAQAFILSQDKAANQTFFSITETHGVVNPVSESVTGASAIVSNLKVVNSSAEQATVSFQVQQKVYTCTLNYMDKNKFITLN